jgi:hypothetical protein
MTTKDVKYTREIKSRVAMAKKNNTQLQEISFHQQIGLNLRKKLTTSSSGA